MKKQTIIALALVLGAGAVAACGDNDQLDDAPVGIIDDTPVFVMTNADAFPNIAVKCYEGSALYTTTRDYDSLTIVQDDPACVDGDPVPEGQK